MNEYGNWAFAGCSNEIENFLGGKVGTEHVFCNAISYMRKLHSNLLQILWSVWTLFPIPFEHTVTTQTQKEMEYISDLWNSSEKYNETIVFKNKIVSPLHFLISILLPFYFLYDCNCKLNSVKMQSKCSQNTYKMQPKCSRNAVKMQSLLGVLIDWKVFSLVWYQMNFCTWCWTIGYHENN